jgi:hypothetical protein
VFLKPRVAAFISARAITHVMANSIILDRQIRLRAIEIKHIRADRMLATEDRFSGQTWP